MITDGYVSVEKSAFSIVRNNLNKGNLFTFGVGSSVNRFLIEGLANVGQGEPFVITQDTDVSATVSSFVELIKSPLMTNLSVKFDGIEAYALEPKAIPALYSKRAVNVVGKWKGDKLEKITITGDINGREYNWSAGESSASDIDNTGLKYLWARKRLKLLSDYNNISYDLKKVRKKWSSHAYSL